MSFRITRKGGGMLRCGVCGTTSFIHGNGYRGPERVFGAMTLALTENNDAAAQTIHQVGVEHAAKEDHREPTVATG